AGGQAADDEGDHEAPSHRSPTRHRPIVTRPSPSVRSIDQTLVFLLLGLGAGAVYAALGLGLVLVHRASGVVHVAHGAVGAYVTYVFVDLRATGDLVLPVGSVHLGDSVPFVVALVISLVVAALLGLVMHALVF